MDNVESNIGLLALCALFTACSVVTLQQQVYDLDYRVRKSQIDNLNAQTISGNMIADTIKIQTEHIEKLTKLEQRIAQLEQHPTNTK